MKTIILYSTHDGQTKKIAEYLAQNLDKGAEVVNLTELTQNLADFDRIIIGASIRYGRFDKNLYKFIEKHTALLQTKLGYFYGVNLTARKAGKDTPETNVYVRKFLAKIHWKPTDSAVFAGALFYPRYKWIDRIMIQFIMKITGGETDPTKEIEFTNWESVKNFAKKIQNMN
ncbi:menaquinone-dependent protoporphyrinogen IX dehydrogenase [Basfia succiniciproducens]|uniref:Protoporphyrinogen IX dehydrogenase [quinone] n=1 Tax=Basfia succiniciproducens TaxID=653940 RepID=A0A1G5EN09_9PAST|nr:menaquinone-dependent protoporphyrinogen IX dehydrogenase [Basfia succiniciproducens]QIM69589.1 protoporphyrinogen oxidase [Basfia succiniciproducens]SCY28377.1 menaquinone-dependent protoporphyrinogen oxidase [Basfia succiniciproducens]SEQ88275.1 menaquinone-dependent protoporphyrinogen oxidase [Basfia succiniciproducens]